jgi:nucleoid DNA-binding protein
MRRTVGPLQTLTGRIEMKHLARRVALRSGIRVPDARRYCELVFGSMVEALVVDGSVKIEGFGTFHTYQMPAYRGVTPPMHVAGPNSQAVPHPNAGQPFTIPAHRRLTWRPEKSLRDAVAAAGVPDEPF